MKTVKAKLISTEGPYLEAIIEIAGEHYRVFDTFSVHKESIPLTTQAFDWEFSSELLEDETWEAIFAGNPEKKIGVEHIDGWQYQCFGKITQINPVIVDCGLFRESDVVSTNDDRVIGEYVSFTIARLGGYAS